MRHRMMLRNKSWTNWGVLVCVCVLGLSGACSSQPEFERVEEYPEGIQTDSVASALSNKLHTTTVSDRYAAGYDEVWAATKRVAHHFEKLHGKPVMRIEEKDGTIELRETHRMDKTKGYNPDAERIEGWKDEFLIKVEALNRTRTKVTVSRRRPRSMWGVIRTRGLQCQNRRLDPYQDRRRSGLNRQPSCQLTRIFAPGTVESLNLETAGAPRAYADFCDPTAVSRLKRLSRVESVSERFIGGR